MAWSSPGRTIAARAAIGIGTLTAASALAGGASAATVQVDKPCYVVRSKTPPTAIVSGSGFVPGDPVSITSGKTAFLDTEATVNAAGQFLVGAKIAPTEPTLVPQVTTLTVQDFSVTGTITATTQARTSFFGVSLISKKKASGLRAFKIKGTWTFAGFRPARMIYGHYTIKHRQVALARFGRAQGPCGYLRVHQVGYPGTPHYTSYPVQFDSNRKYSRRSNPKIITRLNLHTIF